LGGRDSLPDEEEWKKSLLEHRAAVMCSSRRSGSEPKVDDSQPVEDDDGERVVS
jgi:hypothetical protein